MFAGEPLTREKAEKLSKYYFYAGFIGLPWLWVVNFITFHRYAHESPIIQHYIGRSLMFGVIGLTLIFVWAMIAQIAVSPDSPIWIIFPTRWDANAPRQSGYFSSAVYNA